MEYIVRTRIDWIQQLDRLDSGAGMVLFVAGLVYVLVGWRVFKVLITMNCAALGAALGWGIGAAIGGASWGWAAGLGLGGAVLLGALGVRLVKAGVVLCTGLVAAFVGITVTSTLSNEPNVQLVGGVVAFLGTASLVFVAFEHVLIATISLQGALMTVVGALVALREEDGILRYFHQMFVKSSFFLVFCIVALTVIGVCVQLAGVRQMGPPEKTA